MTIHDKLAARIRAEMLRVGKWKDSPHLIGLLHRIERGDFDDILGVREPTLEDVHKEAVRVYGALSLCRIDGDDSDGIAVRVFRRHDATKNHSAALLAPTTAAAYAALRTLPDWKGER